MTEKKTAVIWRKSVYDSGRCPQCGARLIGKGNQPVNVFEEPLPLVGKTYFVCKGCGLPVAFTEPYDGPEQSGTRGGRWKGEIL